MVSSYFDTLSTASLPFSLSAAELTARDKLRMADAGAAHGGIGAVVEQMLRRQLPLPAPNRPYEEVLSELEQLYRNFSAALLVLLNGLAMWDRLDETERERTETALRHTLPRAARRRYEERLRQLQLDVPEVELWLGTVDHQATRTAIAELSDLVTRIQTGTEPPERRAQLARRYAAELGMPILAASEVPEAIRFPSLGAGYVAPGFRVADAGAAGHLVSEAWWSQQRLRPDLIPFLAGHLTLGSTARVPLLVLGQPGSGKSLLTKILAGVLPANEWLVIRVPLRDVPADADLQTQIEVALRAATGEAIGWPALCRASGDAMPLVLLDGFDELLQATGAHQTDYLEKAATFQEREAMLGRPVAVVVTSRTAVADRARCPAGTTVIRLEPFERAQVERWLGYWNEANAANFAAAGLEPLQPETVLAHGELASQPLLLMMLALFDADGNALQRVEPGLGQAELYERLLRRFAVREVSKTGGALPGDRFETEVETELRRLSVVAFAMFNRRRQWTSEEEVDRDLRILLGEAGEATPPGLSSPLTEGQRELGRFFFVHRGEAIRDGRSLRSFEFLHATFGEYLIGRLIARELTDLADDADAQRKRNRPSGIDDAFLHALLSHQPLTMRGNAIDLLQQTLAGWPEDRRGVLRESLLTLFHRSMYRTGDTRYGAYEPMALTVPARHAAYACNLVLLLLMLSAEVHGHELLPESWDRTSLGDIPYNWRNLALLWRSQLPPEGWNGLLDRVELNRIRTDGLRDIRARYLPATGHEDPRPPLPLLDLAWQYDNVPGLQDSARPMGWMFHPPQDIRLHINFTADRRADVAAHVAEAFASSYPALVTAFCRTSSGVTRSAANALVSLWLAGMVHETTDVQSLPRMYDECLDMMDIGFGRADIDTLFANLVMQQFLRDYDRLPVEKRSELSDRFPPPAVD